MALTTAAVGLAVAAVVASPPGAAAATDDHRGLAGVPDASPVGAGVATVRGDGSDDREIDAGQRVALRAAGWAVPAKLASTWVLRSARVLTRGVADPGTLQLVYTRGDQTLSLFQRGVPPDWSSVPAGDEAVSELSGSVREWPDAEPARLMWQAEGHTFVLVGRADRSALLEAARSLPTADPAGLWDRLRHGVDRLLARLTI